MLDPLLLVRQLPSEEWSRLEEIYRLNGDRLPPAEQNTAVVAEAEGRIVGMWGVNLVAHAGPLWVAPEFRGQGVPDRMHPLVDKLVQGLGAPGYFMFPSNAQSERVAARCGLALCDWKVFKKEF